MSLKRSNTIALILIISASLCWTFGSRTLKGGSGVGDASTTMPLHYGEAGTLPSHGNTSIPATENVSQENSRPTAATNSPDMSDQYIDSGKKISRLDKYAGYILCFSAVAAAVIGVLFLRQRNPFFGPDGICVLGGVTFLILEFVRHADYILWSQVYDSLSFGWAVVSLFGLLLTIREIWGWILNRCAWNWSLVYRLFVSQRRPQTGLLLVSAWLALNTFAVSSLLLTRSLSYVLFPVFCFSACIFWGIGQLWRYGSDLQHFKTQLDNFQNGLPVLVKDGAFSETETQLLEVQAQHEEAVRTAVISERFKVELIANVSHDLRTPLTSILGYSELLQRENLSADGTEQLRRLHQKAGYMLELVESLFELTKVSSGVLESTKEPIDLIRLLEQTIGLFDDQLLHVGLVVRRNYCAQSICVITDGGRMHQVFANLLGNAIKYAMVGTRIYLDVKETEDKYCVRMVNTASYEMDFDPDEIMQRFARGDKARSTKGSGLGLAIAKTYTESVGGSFRIAVDGDQFSAIVELPKTERNL